MIYNKSAADDDKYNPFKVENKLQAKIVPKKHQRVNRRISNWIDRDADSDFASAFDWGSQ